MNESSTEPWAHGAALEKSVAAILASARPLPDGDEMVIDELTDDEELRFADAIRRV